jgi:hypothetical protein
VYTSHQNDLEAYSINHYSSISRDLVEVSYQLTCKKKTRKFISTSRESRVMISLSRSHSHLCLVSTIFLDLTIILDRSSTARWNDSRSRKWDMRVDICNWNDIRTRHYIVYISVKDNSSHRRFSMSEFAFFF